VQRECYNRIGDYITTWRLKFAGAGAILFGIAGAVCPILFVADAGSPYRQASASRPDISWCMIAVCAHLYLVLAGIRLLKGRKPWLLGYFFVLETAYSGFLIVSLPGLVSLGVISAKEARWAADVSVGFLAQLCLGFPLWAWLLARRSERGERTYG
jgi:hypothetical protein